MARGQDTRYHPNRQVGDRRWYGSIEGSTGAFGATDDAYVTGQHDQLGVTPVGRSNEGFMASYGRHSPTGMHTSADSVPLDVYEAGPFRTPMRAQMAAEGLANRSNRGVDMSRHYSGTY